MNYLDKSRVATNFNKVARDYEQHAVLQKLVVEQLLARLEVMTLEPKWIIDAGSGPGFGARALRNKYRGARVMQIDLSHTMLFYSRRKAARWFSGQYYVCADIEELPVLTGSADLVFSSLVLQWCNNPDRVFAESRRILRANGLFLFATLGPESLREMRDCWYRVDTGTHVHTFPDMHLVGDGLVRAGLEGVVMESEQITMTYEHCDRIMRDLKAVGARNTESTRNKGLTGRHKMQQVMQNYEQYRVNGLLPVTYEIIYGHAWAPMHPYLPPGDRAVFVPVDTVKRRPRT